MRYIAAFFVYAHIYVKAKRNTKNEENHINRGIQQ